MYDTKEFKSTNIVWLLATDADFAKTLRELQLRGAFYLFFFLGIFKNFVEKNHDQPLILLQKKKINNDFYTIFKTLFEVYQNVTLDTTVFTFCHKY